MTDGGWGALVLGAVGLVVWLWPEVVAARARRAARLERQRRQIHVDPENVDDMGWHVIGGTRLLKLLRRCERGEKADLVYAELYANATHEDVP